jgi:hypothetical protein
MFPEYGADLPLWASGNLGADDVDLSEGLISRLRAWNHEWQSQPPEQPSRWSARELNDWKQRGYRLAAQVQAELTDTEILVDDDHGERVPLRRIWGQD